MADRDTESAGHVRKRQFQPSITSYFERSQSSSSLQPRSQLSPPVPAETQASLLSVGMRVRKSVPEGYKTHETMPGSPSVPSTAPAGADTTPWSINNVGAVKELQPFCGLHKTGGLAQQDRTWVPNSSASTISSRGNASDAPGLSTSQSTLSSTQSSFTSAGNGKMTTHKRTFEEEIEEEIEEDMDRFFDEMDASDPLEEQTMRLRPIAQPKVKGRRLAEVACDVSMTAQNDFDDSEASFLCPPNGLDLA